MSFANADAATRPQLARLGSRLGGIALRVSVLAGLLVVWQLVTMLVDDPVNWPTFTRIAGRLWQIWLANPAAWTANLEPSLVRLLLGWASAALIGMAVGTLIGLSARARDFVDPVIQFLRAVPPPTLLPLFIVLFGIEDLMKVMMILFGIVWPVLLNTADGVGSVEPLLRDTGRAYRITPIDQLIRIILPSAAPKIFAGLRVSLSIAVILMVISELYAATDGVGFVLVQAQRTFRSLDVWATIVFLGIIGYTLNAILALVEGYVLSWHRGAMATRA